MAQSVFPISSASTQPPLHPTSIPTNVTLRNTYTTSQSGLTYPAGITQVFAVLVGGGGSGGNGGGQGGTYGSGGGGGGGAVSMAWIPAPATITIGSSNGYSKIANFLSHPGGTGQTQDYYGQEFASGPGFFGAGAGGGSTYNPVFPGTNPFIGGGSAMLVRGSGNSIEVKVSAFQPGVHSGKGGNYDAVGMAGSIIGGGGGGGSSSGNGAAGGAGYFSGGNGATSGVARGGGGGSGYLAAGSNASGTVGGTGGSGGGGGGGGGVQDGTLGGSGGSGGTGCCLIYY